MKQKRGLGRGLSALIPDEPIQETKVNDDTDNITNVEISLIEPNINQPRKEFGPEALQEMSESIKKYGVLQPIIVRKVVDGYQIIAGERRWRASKEAGLKEIPCIIKDVEEIVTAEIAITENIQREDLNAIEEAMAYKSLIDKYDLTQEQVSKSVGKSRPYIANLLRLLTLDERVIILISNGEISTGHGKALLQLNDKGKQYEVADLIVEKELSVRATEKLIKELNDNTKVKGKEIKDKDPNVIYIEDSLRKLLGTKVNINVGKNKGKIEIEYYNNEDLDRILDILNK